MSGALLELDQIMLEPNERVRLGLYRAWKDRAVAKVTTTFTFDRLMALQMGETELMKRAMYDAVNRIAKVIVEESALSWVQAPELDMDAMRVTFRCDVLKERP